MQIGVRITCIFRDQITQLIFYLILQRQRKTKRGLKDHASDLNIKLFICSKILQNKLLLDYNQIQIKNKVGKSYPSYAPGV